MRVPFGIKPVLVFMALILSAFFADCAFALEPVTLRDGERGTTEDLYPIPDENDLLFYGNERFGYNVNVPKIFTKVVMLPENGDGMILESEDGTAGFRVSGGFLMVEGGEALYERYAETLQDIGGLENASFHDAGDDYWEICWWEGNLFLKRKFVISDEAWCECDIFYRSEREGDDPLDAITDRALESLAFAVG